MIDKRFIETNCHLQPWNSYNTNVNSHESINCCILILISGGKKDISDVLVAQKTTEIKNLLFVYLNWHFLKLVRPNTFLSTWRALITCHSWHPSHYLMLQCFPILIKSNAYILWICFLPVWWSKCKISTPWCVTVIIQWILLRPVYQPAKWRKSPANRRMSPLCRPWTVTSVQQGPPVAVSQCQLSASPGQLVSVTYQHQERPLTTPNGLN